MGEGGLSAQYFLHEMQLAEVQDYIKGQDRRHRQDWERSRMLIQAIFGCLTGDVPEIPFAWDHEYTPEEKAKRDQDNEKAWEELKRQCEEMNRKHKEEQDNGKSNTMADTVQES